MKRQTVVSGNISGSKSQFNLETLSFECKKLVKELFPRDGIPMKFRIGYTENQNYRKRSKIRPLESKVWTYTTTWKQLLRKLFALKRDPNGSKFEKYTTCSSCTIHF